MNDDRTKIFGAEIARLTSREGFRAGDVASGTVCWRRPTASGGVNRQSKRRRCVFLALRYRRLLVVVINSQVNRRLGITGAAGY